MIFVRPGARASVADVQRSPTPARMIFAQAGRSVAEPALTWLLHTAVSNSPSRAAKTSATCSQPTRSRKVLLRP